MRRHERRAWSRRLADVIIGAMVAVLALGPVVWGLSTSFKLPKDLFKFPPQLIPDDPTLSNYARLFKEGIGIPILNSTIITALTILLALTIGSLAGYALARFQFRGKAAVMLIVIIVMSIPLPSLIVPTFTFAANVGLINTRLGLVLFYTAYQLPLAVWILYGFFTTVPQEIEQAAMVDGYSRLQTLRKIVLPLSLPGLIAAGLFVLTFAWNDFIVALVLTNSEAVRTLPVAIYFFLGFFGREWGPLTAAAMISIVPVIAIFVLFQRYFVSGMTTGSMKG